MAQLNLNGYPVISGTISAPRVGVWHADLLLDTEENIPSDVTLSANGIPFMAGTNERSTQYLGITQIRMIGGAGGMQKPASPRYYGGINLRSVLADLAKDGGESISDTSDSAVLSKPLDGWTTVRTAVGRLVAELLRPTGAIWRILADGTLWVGSETWPQAPESWTELGYDHQNGVMSVGLNYPSLLPGSALGDFKIDRVEHTISGEKIRTLVWEARGEAVGDEFVSLGRGSIRPFDYLAMYAGSMTAQDGQTFSIQPDDDRIPSMSRVPIRNGIPGLEMTVAPGARMLVGWRNGDPREAFCAHWAGAETVASIILRVGVEGLGGTIELGDSPLNPAAHGLVLGGAIDPFTKAPHSSVGILGVGVSTAIMAKPL